jgi:hypothetical protein
MTEIQSLHGTTVAEIFSSGLDDRKEIDAVAMAVLWANGRYRPCENRSPMDRHSKARKSARRWRAQGRPPRLAR